MVSRYYQKKGFEKKHVKDITISLNKERKNDEKGLRQISNSF